MANHTNHVHCDHGVYDAAYKPRRRSNNDIKLAIGVVTSISLYD